MASALQVTYLHHSGFAVQTPDTLLIFDDAQDPPDEEGSLANGHITRSLIASHKRTLYLISHAHSDHFNPKIYDMADVGNVQYVLGYDVPIPHPGFRMMPNERISFGGIEIRAYGSTDEGVSFYVRVEGWNLFHAGDLNLWHWREESSLKEIEQAEADYLQTVAPIVGQPIDFAFFPLDPRMGERYDAGAQHFLMHAKPRIMIPMHWWDRSDAAKDFARRNRSRHAEIIALTTPGETIHAQKLEDGAITLGL